MKKTMRVALAVMLAAMMLFTNVSAYILIDNCDVFQFDDTAKWGGSYIEAVEADDAPEGTGYVKATPAGGVAQLTKVWDDIDLSEMTEGYLHFDYYVDDAASVTGGQIEMTSAGKADVEENSWDLMSVELVDGWNHIALKISEGAIVSGGLDYAGFNNFRVYAFTGNAENWFAVDNLGIGDENGITLPVDNCDALGEESTFVGNSWGASGDVTVAEDGADAVKEGEGAISVVAKDTLIIAAAIQEPIDISEYAEDGYLMFWIWMSDPYGTSLGGQIELTSGGSPDVEEIGWSMAELSYIGEGWNAVALPFSAASTYMDGVDLTAMNYFRIYDFVVTGEDVEMRIDQLCVGSKEDAIANGFLVEEEETVEETEEETEEAVEETEEAVEETEEAVEETEAEPEDNNAAADPGANPTEEGGDSIGIIVGIVVAAVVVIAVVAVIIAKSKKK